MTASSTSRVTCGLRTPPTEVGASGFHHLATTKTNPQNVGSWAPTPHPKSPWTGPQPAHDHRPLRQKPQTKNSTLIVIATACNSTSPAPTLPPHPSPTCQAIQTSSFPTTPHLPTTLSTPLPNLGGSAKPPNTSLAIVPATLAVKSQASISNSGLSCRRHLFFCPTAHRSHYKRGCGGV